MSYECYCDYDPPEWMSQRMVKKSRKPHKCYECSAPIFVGEPYEYTSGKWDGYTDFFHTCTRCVELREWAKISVPCFCWGFGNLHDDVREMVREVVHDAPAGFFMEFGRRMVAIRQERQRRVSLQDRGQS